MARGSRVFALLAAVLMGLFPFGGTAVRAAPPTVTVTAGVLYRIKTLTTSAGPVVAHILSVDLAEPNVRLSVVEAHNRLLGGPQTLSSMARRTGAVAGINGDDFAMDGNGKPVGMVAIGGTLWQSPKDGIAVFGQTPAGRLAIAPERFAGQITAGHASLPLLAVNRVHDLGPEGAVLFTGRLGAAVTMPAATVAFLQPVSSRGKPAYRVTALDWSATTLPVLGPMAALVAPAGSSAGIWLAQHLRSGASVAVTYQLSPIPRFRWALSGGPIILEHGHWVNLPSTVAAKTAPDRLNPLTAVGINAAGTRAWLVVFDGRDPGTSVGATYREAAAFLAQAGAVTAMLLDGGGSSEMVVRMPGAIQATVANRPADGHERPVANGLFVYSREVHPGPPARLVVNGGRPLALLAGTAVHLPAYALDPLDNPVPVRWTVQAEPATLATARGLDLTAGQPGQGRLWATATAGRAVAPATTWIPLEVVSRLGRLWLSPSRAELEAGNTVTFAVYAAAPDGTPVTLPPSAVHWRLDPPGLAAWAGPGVVRAEAGFGTVTVTAEAGGAVATATLRVGTRAVVLDPLDAPSAWRLVLHGASAVLRPVAAPSPPQGSGGLQLAYRIPAASGVHQLVLVPTRGPLVLPLGPGGARPEAVGFWVYGDGQGLDLAVALHDGAGQPLVFYPTFVTFHGWRFVQATLPQAAPLPWSLDYLDALVIDPKVPLQGALILSHLDVFYPPPG
ncbi:MAG: phosphodiester glycosidase family protein [Firmicutes bacterium]|nr:phosphodiester glycosidase family protein [Alicyclobacillaceae bacterium]MCL6497760.1 phosphodiester glycosidase family protein [Bacillota bacterium]